MLLPGICCSISIFCAFLCLTGVEVQLRMAGDSRVLMDHNMEIGVTPAQVSCAAFAGRETDRTKKTVERQ